jgi:spore maturation protein A
MLNVIWFAMLLLSVVCAVLTGHVAELILSVTEQAKFAFNLALSLAGIFIFWLGLMKIAQEAGLIRALARRLRPVLAWLFPSVPPEHPAMGDMVMNLSANMMGLSNAATPFGLQAMRALAQLNMNTGVASDAMCTFLALNTSSVQLIPFTAIGYLSAAGAHHPTDIIISSLLATMCSTLVAVIADRLFRNLSRRKVTHDQGGVKQALEPEEAQ